MAVKIFFLPDPEEIPWDRISRGTLAGMPTNQKVIDIIISSPKRPPPEVKESLSSEKNQKRGAAFISQFSS